MIIDGTIFLLAPTAGVFGYVLYDMRRIRREAAAPPAERRAAPVVIVRPGAEPHPSMTLASREAA